MAHQFSLSCILFILWKCWIIYVGAREGIPGISNVGFEHKLTGFNHGVHRNPWRESTSVASKEEYQNLYSSHENQQKSRNTDIFTPLFIPPGFPVEDFSNDIIDDETTVDQMTEFLFTLSPATQYTFHTNGIRLTQTTPPKGSNNVQIFGDQYGVLNIQGKHYLLNINREKNNKREMPYPTN
mmetsp:Transcript_11848/g.15492  ORF Transcript_11848/g.15492 Transcript_11848/m.15492 type:complete len:182 (+) Transcript_11848:135-680(+)|eukprot:CAMPEP_0117745884 /NCGR_PEP_ID=MMETSP0947-20121206/7631_1 /TAXON_ID=44440 /ORGANISM="Chattonella subsalsa, Strain CCMP2191" /LENGTH=181 /DNA_ID=CAMNT_0005563131 /DNA_START=135 /DNA_END=680 /DNA_ORIENTATION=+